MALCVHLLAGCSSVASINDRALLLGAEKAPLGPKPAAIPFVPPTRTEYRIGARDLLEVEVYELDEPNKPRQIKTRVTQEGAILIPLIGSLAVAGKTAREVQAEITDKLGKDYLVNPTVSVMVLEHQARRVTILGAVQTPGSFFLKENSTTLVDVLALCGGPNEKAGSSVYVVRGGIVAGPEVREASSSKVAPSSGNGRVLRIDLTNLVEHGDPAANCVLEDGDVVHVPPAPQIFVMGQVAQGGAFPLRGEITLLKAIALAGGLKDEATPSATILIRIGEQGRESIPIDLTEVEAGSEKDLKMQADDVLVVSESGGNRFVRGIGSFFRGLFHVGYALR